MFLFLPLFLLLIMTIMITQTATSISNIATMTAIIIIAREEDDAPVLLEGVVDG